MPTKVMRCNYMGDCPKCGMYLSPPHDGYCPNCKKQTIGEVREADEICPECGAKLPPSVREQRGDYHSELVTYCPCGATYTGGV